MYIFDVEIVMCDVLRRVLYGCYKDLWLSKYVIAVKEKKKKLLYCITPMCISSSISLFCLMLQYIIYLVLILMAFFHLLMSSPLHDQMNILTGNEKQQKRNLYLYVVKDIF